MRGKRESSLIPNGLCQRRKAPPCAALDVVTPSRHQVICRRRRRCTRQAFTNEQRECLCHRRRAQPRDGSFARECIGQGRREVIRHAHHRVGTERLAAHVLDRVVDVARAAARWAIQLMHRRVVISAAQRHVVGLSAKPGRVRRAQRQHDRGQPDRRVCVTRAERAERDLEIFHAGQGARGVRQRTLAAFLRGWHRWLDRRAQTTFTRVIASGRSAPNARW